MGIYEEFASFYAKGPYPEFSRRIAEVFPVVLERFGVRPHTILDLACGEGTFAVAMARQGSRLIGVDRSAQMLAFARERAKRARVAVDFRRQDIRAIEFDAEFDLVTCWNDSLNYILERSDLEETFRRAARALQPGGLFAFDVNTVFGLAAYWQRQPLFVHQDTADCFELHRTSYDYETNIATLTITGFVKRGRHWVRMEEIHHERAYTLEEIRHGLKRARLQERACWSSLERMDDLELESPRAWFVAQKPGDAGQ